MQNELSLSKNALYDTQIITVTNHSKKTQLRCRICHEDSNSQLELKTYCGCKQKMAYTHSSCLQTYLSTKINRCLQVERDSEESLTCEKCQQKYHVNHIITRKCCQLEKIKKNIIRKNYLFGVCLFGIIISIIVLAVSSDLLKKSSFKSSSTPTGQMQIQICFIILFSLLLIFLVYKLIDKFFTQRIAKVFA